MEWLKDKKNLPIVVALAVFILLATGGLIAFEMGAFSGGSSPNVVAQTGLPPGGSPGSVPPTGPTPVAPPRGFPEGALARRGGVPGAASALPSTDAVVKKTNALNPAVGPDPFYIPGGQKKIAEAQASIAGLKLPVREVVGPLNLFQLRPPVPPAPPAPPNTARDQNLASNYRLAGVITGGDGVNAILEFGGNSQSVRAGDTLSDGSKVQNIHTTSITLQMADGAVVSLPLSAGSPDQGTYNPYGQQQYPVQQPYPGQQPYPVQDPTTN